MPSLKDLKVRINSVKSTQKITSAMKMVAAAKLRRAQEQAEAARPYAERMERMLGSLAASMQGRDGAPALLAGNGRDRIQLVVVMTSDRGLCGGFNSSIVRAARRKVQELRDQGKEVKLFCVGREFFLCLPKLSFLGILRRLLIHVKQLFVDWLRTFVCSMCLLVCQMIIVVFVW